MDRVDEMSQDIVKYNTYLRNTSKQQQQKHQVGIVGKLSEQDSFLSMMLQVTFKMTWIIFVKALTLS